MSSQKTRFLRLHKWLGIDGVKREEFNENFEIIDAKLDEATTQLADTELKKADRGFVENKINEVNVELNDLGTNKANRSDVRLKSAKLGLDDLSSEVIASMSGESTFELLSIPQDRSVTPEKTVMFKGGKNLFDKSAIATGYIINQNNGNLQAASNYNASDFIPITGGQVYTRNFSHSLAWYDANKVFISGQATVSNAGTTTTITAPSNARYLRVTAPLETSNPTKLSTFQIETGNVATPFEDFGYYIEDKFIKYNEFDANNIKDKSVLGEKVGAEVLVLDFKNLFDKESVVYGYLVNNSTGNLQASPNYSASDYIPVKGGQQYTRNFSHFYAWYDANKIYISGGTAATNVNEPTTITAPLNAKYLRTTAPRATSTPININMFQVEPGSEATNYSPYGLTLPSERDGIPINYDNQNNWLGFKGDSLGDSITAQAKWQPYVTNVLKLTSFANHGIGGTRISGTADNAFWQDARINALNNDANLITVMGGTNDWAQNAPLGEVSRSNIDTNTFYGACNVMFKKLVTRFPNKRIICMGTPFGTYPGRSGWTDTSGLVNNLGLMAIDYGEVLMKVARWHGIPSVDIGGQTGWNENNVSTYVTNDGAYLHPNDLGGKRIAEVLIGKLRVIEPIG